MHDHISTISQNPTQKFHEKLKNPKIFEKPQNLGLNAWNVWEREDLEVIPQERGLNKAETWLEWRFKCGREDWIEREGFILSREMWESEI